MTSEIYLAVDGDISWSEVKPHTAFSHYQGSLQLNILQMWGFGHDLTCSASGEARAGEQ